MTAADVLHELDRAIIRLDKVKPVAIAAGDTEFFMGIRRGLSEFRSMIRSYDFGKSTRKNKSPRRNTNAH